MNPHFINAICATCVFAGSAYGEQEADSVRQELAQIVASTYPETWSGRVIWAYGLIPDPEPMVRTVVHLELPSRKHIIGTMRFDGTTNIEECSDGIINVSLEGGTPHLIPLGYGGLAKESAAMAYCFMAEPARYDVSRLDAGYLVSELAGSWIVEFDRSGLPVKAKCGLVELRYEKYVVIDGCPWATLVVVARGGDGNESFIRGEIESRSFGISHFDYEQYANLKWRDKQGRPIVYFAGHSMLAGDARKRIWPDTADDWKAAIVAEGRENDRDSGDPQDPGRQTRLRNPQAFLGVTFDTILWLGVIATLVGALGIWRSRRSA